MTPEKSMLLAHLSESLHSLGLLDVCDRCKLRLAGVKDSREHKAVGCRQNGPSEAKKARLDENGREDASSQHANICRACLGVLQDEHMKEAVKEVAEALRLSGYDAERFSVSLALPVSMAMRSYSLNLVLAEKVALFDEDEVVPIKQVKMEIKSPLL